jgi:hypothetical protein
MVTAAGEHHVGHRFRPSFFFWMTVVMAVFVFSGFAFTYLQPMATGALPSLPPIVHLHGVFFFGWMILLVLQPALVNSGNVRLHRSIGTFGIVVATGVIMIGTMITLMFGGATPLETANYYDLMYLGLTAVLGFAVLFTAAIRQVRQPDNHRRLILFATIPLLPPGINRLYQVTLELDALPVLGTYLTMSALAVAILIFDWRTLGRISKASMFGAGVVIGLQLLHVPIANSAAFADLCGYLTGLVYYR